MSGCTPIRHLARPIWSALLAGVLVGSMAACGSPASTDGNVSDGASTGACPVGDAMCYETGADDRCRPEAVDCSDTGAPERDVLLDAAADLLGRAETDLPDDVIVGRRGDETSVASDDNVLGQRTVELADVDGSGYRVVVVTVVLSDGPRRLELTPG